MLTRLKRLNRFTITIAARQAFGIYLIKSKRTNKQRRRMEAEISVFIGVLEPILSIKEERLSEPEGE